MDGRGFDELTRSLAGGRSRRAVLKGLLGLGGAAIATTVGARGADAQWSVQVCLPDGTGRYILRLVPKASVPLYVNQYGAVLAEAGSCPACVAGYRPCGSGCIPESHCCSNSDCSGTNQVCDDGSCVCVPDCAGAECGDDGCGGSCGSCTPPDICDESRQCVCHPLTPEEACAGAMCGEVEDRGCGLTVNCSGSCGGSICWQSNEGSNHYCLSQWTNCPSLHRDCTEDSDCAGTSIDDLICRNGSCGRCWVDGDCPAGWVCVAYICGGDNGSGICGLPV